MTTPSSPSLFERITAEHPKPTIRRQRDPSRPYVDLRAVTDEAKAIARDADVIATLAKEIEGTPEHVTLSQLRMQAMEANPALQPAARFASAAATAVKLLDGIRARCSEVSDLLDDGGREPERVNVRQMLVTLRATEAELGHLVDSLAGDLGLVEVARQ